MTMTRPLNRDKADAELQLHIKKATSPDETAPKQKHVRGMLRSRRKCLLVGNILSFVCQVSYQDHQRR